MRGYGGLSEGDARHGVFLQHAGSKITSGGGPVIVEGTTGGKFVSFDSSGVHVRFDTEISAGGSGSVSVTGVVNAVQGGFHHGVSLQGTGTITSNGGNVSVQGTGSTHASSSNSRGVSVEGGGTITAGGSGSVSVSGTGGTSANFGNYGVRVIGSGSIISSSGGNITVQGTGAGSSPIGVQVTTDGIITASAAGIAVLADNINLASTTSISTGGSVLIGPRTAGYQVDIGTETAGKLSLTDAELDTVTASGLLTLGDSAAGDVTISSSITRSSSTNLRLLSNANVFQDASINVNGGSVLLTPGASGSYQPRAAGLEILGGTVENTAGRTFSFAINGTSADTGFTRLGVGASAVLSSPTLALTGSYVPTLGQQFTIVSASSLTGTFNGLPTGSTVTFNGRTLRVDNFFNSVRLTDITATTRVALDGSGNLVLSDTSAQTNNFAISSNGTAITITDSVGTFDDPALPGFTVSGAGHTLTVLLSAITGPKIIVNGMAANDTLTANLAQSLGKNLDFNGGAGGNDTLVITGGATTSYVSTYLNANDGSVAFTGAIAGTIAYTGLEPVDIDVSAEVAEFVFLGAAEVITVTDETANDGFMRINSNLLGELTNFEIPTSQLIIRTSTGAAGADTVTISSVDAQFRASVLIDTDGGDTVNLDAALTLGSATSAGNFTINNANTVNLNANISTNAGTNAGSISITGPVTLGANVALTTDAGGTDGNITFNNSLNADVIGNTRSLTVTAGTGAATFANVGASRSLQGLSVSAGSIAIGSIGAASGGASLTATNITLNGNIRADQNPGDNTTGGATAGPVQLSGAVALGANVLVDATSDTSATITYWQQRDRGADADAELRFRQHDTEQHELRHADGSHLARDRRRGRDLRGFHHHHRRRDGHQHRHGEHTVRQHRRRGRELHQVRSWNADTVGSQ